ncbi:NUDIX hydrolase [Bacteroidota bacterium]
MYKVFFEDRLFILSESPVKNMSYKISDYYKYKDAGDLQDTIIQFEKNKSISGINIYDKDVELLYEKFTKLFLFIDAAGGLVKNSRNEFLFIYRKGKWDLPKGKVEKNEKFSEAAIREVEEECGISAVEIKSFICHTFHTYKIHNTPVLKRTWWYEMYYSRNEKLKPQLEENITNLDWFSKKNMNLIFESTYSSINEILSVFFPRS